MFNKVSENSTLLASIRSCALITSRINVRIGTIWSHINIVEALRLFCPVGLHGMIVEFYKLQEIRRYIKGEDVAARHSKAGTL